jgi:hypothetical protein
MSHCNGVFDVTAVSLPLMRVESEGECEDGVLEASGAGDVESVGGLDSKGPDNRDDGTSKRKLHVSPFFSQFAHVGCLQSHCTYVSFGPGSIGHVHVQTNQV